MNLNGKKVWITGASAGIGKAITLAFAERGAQLIISSRRREALEEVRSQCPAPDKVMVQPLDMSDLEAIPTIAEKVIQEVGPIDILVNNAGISQRSLVKDTPMEIDQKIMNINFFGAIALTKAVLPGMLEQKSGQFVVISSLVGKVESPMRSTYAASKHALHGFFDSLRAETFDQGVQVLMVCPGFIKTDISINAITSDGSKQNKMDDNQANGLLPEVVARRILRAIEGGKNEIYIGKREVVAIYLKRWLPGVFARIIRKAKVT
jgi:dehydrogenase/reductase SDR family protein 7B